MTIAQDMSNAFVGGVERMKVKVGRYAPPPMVGRRGRSILLEQEASALPHANNPR